MPIQKHDRVAYTGQGATPEDAKHLGTVVCVLDGGQKIDIRWDNEARSYGRNIDDFTVVEEGYLSLGDRILADLDVTPRHDAEQDALLMQTQHLIIDLLAEFKRTH